MGGNTNCQYPFITFEMFIFPLILLLSRLKGHEGRYGFVYNEFQQRTLQVQNRTGNYATFGYQTNWCNGNLGILSVASCI
jgi:hypothetical protein